jgi:hypothetical protein
MFVFYIIVLGLNIIKEHEKETLYEYILNVDGFSKTIRNKLIEFGTKKNDFKIP